MLGVVVVLVVVAALAEASPQNRLLSSKQCKEQFEKLRVLERIEEQGNRFEDFGYMSNMIDCVTCACPNGGDSCCDKDGIDIRELSPTAFEDVSQSTCDSDYCHCVRREGTKVMSELKIGKSSDGKSYRDFHDRVDKYYRQERKTCP